MTVARLGLEGKCFRSWVVFSLTLPPLEARVRQMQPAECAAAGLFLSDAMVKQIWGTEERGIIHSS